MNGFAMAYADGFAALYAAYGTLWLQYGGLGWDCAGLRSVALISERAAASSYRLTFSSGVRVGLVLQMPEPVVRLRRLDPAYDEIDSWSDDLLKLLPYTAPDGWSSSAVSVGEMCVRLTELWSAGVRREQGS